MTEQPVRRVTPTSTYRLQLTRDFGFAAAAEQAGYLAALGVTHVYLAPILQAAPGSRHGYDVIDHSRVSADLGGEDAFRAMARRFHDNGLGIVVDIVPNHMAIPAPESLNKQLWSVLRDGPASRYARWFDIDWTAQDGRLLLPILGAPAERCLDDFTIDLDARQPEPVLRYFEHELPLREGTARLPLRELLDRQHYRLADWRTANTDLNWRRFFDITSLIAVRVEDKEVFDATHAVPLRLMAEGLIDGLRVDHPDGLADPRGYLRRLAGATGGRWVVVEKILADGEMLPADWPCAGTTGYDVLNLVGGLFIDPAGAQPLTDAYVRFTGGAGSFPPVALEAKRYAAGHTFAAELSRLVRLLGRAGIPALPGDTGGPAGFDAGDLHTALAELIASFEVYRAYLVPGEPPRPESMAAVDAAVRAARQQLRRQDGQQQDRLLRALAAVQAAVTGTDLAASGDADLARAEVVVRFQQVTGPVLAKGVEDTACYRWSRLTGLNEVGGDPGRFGGTVAEFHREAGRLAADWPDTMTTLSTHDTKRQEDVRARLATLAEYPQEWERAVARWHADATGLTDGAAAQRTDRAPDHDLEYLMWQTLVGGWLIGGERMRDYLAKAMREAKTRTSWTDPDPGYEAATIGFADAVLGDASLTCRIAEFVAQIVPDARVNTLGAKLIQLTMPGVPDVYQGCELTGLALVDPDNRRDVDFGRRRRLLAALDRWPAARPGRGEAARDLPCPAVAQDPSGLVLRRLRTAGRGRPGGGARRRVRPGRSRGDGGDPAARPGCGGVAGGRTRSCRCPARRGVTC